jgi:Carboxypeptidase regulatory-like domain/TonB dependent receptor
MSRTHAAFLLAFVVSGWTNAAAQTRATTADLVGVVYDQSRGVLPGATVTATSTDTNQTRSTVTDGSGRFVLPALPPGMYRVMAELDGFAPYTQEGVALQLGTEVELDFTLRVAALQQQVNVVASPVLVDRGQTAVATVVTQQQINDLPINGRDFISFSVITPGVTRDNTPQQGASATTGLTFAGQRARSNNISVDGLDNNDITVGSVRAVFSQEAVREFQVVTNSYSAEFGKASGGVVNIITKSGTNTPAGNAFFFFRDSALNSKSYFERFTPAGDPLTREKAPYGQKQFGATFGGPIQKDRTFVFASYERLDINASNVVTIDDTTPVILFGQPIGTPAGILRAAGFPVETGDVPYAIRSNQFLMKVDRKLSVNHNGSLRYNYADAFNENIEPWGGLVARSRGAVRDSVDNMLAASYTAILSPKIVNELRMQFARRDQKVNSLDPNCNGPCVGEDQGGPTLEVLGVASVGRNRFEPQPRLNDRYQVLETFTVFRGKHQWKAGLDYNYVNHKVQALPLHFGGRYLFQSLPAIPGLLPAPITGIQALYLGLPAAYIQGYGNSSATYGYSDLSLFAQDDWRVTGNLTVKLGARYQNQFWPGRLYNTPGVPDTYPVPRDNNNLAPRVAVSWRPTGSATTVLHGSYGIFYDNLVTGAAGIAYIINGAEGVRTLVSRFPASIAAWNTPGHKLPEPPGGTVPSLVIALDPGLKASYAHHLSAGVDRELPHRVRLTANYVFARGLAQLGTIDYNPIVPALGAGRRPLDVGGRAGTSASVLQYTSFGETWYHGMTLAASKQLGQRYQFLASYTLSKVDDTSTDFPSAFIPQNNGRGRNPANPKGLPVGFDPDSERGPSLQDQRHHLSLSGVYAAPRHLYVSAIITGVSGRPYNVIAGADLNGDGDGGTIPGPDRARTNPADPGTSIQRNSGTLPSQATVDLRVNKIVPIGGRTRLEAIFEVFNLFNRANFTDVNNVFGTGAYPSNPLPTFGQFLQTGPSRQMQLAVKIAF